MSQLNAERKTLELLAEEFVARYRRGERPALTEYINAHPELANDIRELFPTLVMMEELAPGDSESFSQPTVPVVEPPRLSLGDYRLLREIGRGGMGIVYEAEQLSLGRRVALKVLRQAVGDATVRQRFHREARAAAQLHHTNIVPVFEVGENQDSCWYAMQLILGQGLDQIIEELRPLRWPAASRTDVPQARPQLSQVTQTLVSGKFDCPALDPSTPAPALVETSSGPAAIDATDSTRLTSRSELSAGDSSGNQYYRSVARIGRQAAEALAYAHVRGIIHRDIKPSNLLLDTAGVVWITDFGLAKTQDSALTTTGDIVGTVRYMAPERLIGEGDERGDVYALGLTLFELLVLRPAFEARDRLQLIDRIKNQEPTRPRTLDRRIPRDLETIILKAIDKEAKRRYQKAEEMAEDLRRFLANEPIQARRTSELERLRLWSRRHPELAVLWLVLTLVAAGATTTAFYLRATLTKSEENRHRAEDAELDGKHKLWLSYLSQARATRMSRQAGQRFDSLRAIQAALALPIPPDHALSELRSEAIAALCLPDMELAREGGSALLGSEGFVIDAAFQRYAIADKDGNVFIRRLSDDNELLQLTGVGLVGYGGLQFSPDGRFLNQRCAFQGGVLARLWDLEAPQPRVVLEGNQGGLTFRADSRQCAASYRDRTIRVFETESGRELRRFRFPSMPPGCRVLWNPRLPQIVLAAGTYLRLLNMETGELSELGPKFVNGNGYDQLAWHPEGRLLAVSDLEMKIHLWHVPTNRTIMPPLEGHKSNGIDIRFNHAGDRLLSSDWSGSWYLWDTRSGRLFLTMPACRGNLCFSPDDRLVGGGGSGKVSRFYLRRGEELRTVVHRSPTSKRSYNTEGGSIIDPEGRLCAIAMHDSVEGIPLVDVVRGEEVAVLPLPGNNPLRFDRDGALWTYGAAGVLRWPVTTDPQRGKRHYGPPQRVWLGGDGGISGSADLRVLARSQNSRGTLVFHRDSKRLLRLGPQEDVRFPSVSPDGRWVATGSHWLHEGAGVKVWDARDGKHVKDLPVVSGRVQFSPDGKWLLTASDGPRLWAVGTWEEGPDLGGSAMNGQGAFSADGKLLALGDAPGVVRLVDADTGAEVARLQIPEQTRLGPGCFTPDGTRLIAGGLESRELYVFDLPAIRAGLAELGLDWDASPFPPSDHLKNPPPLQVTVDLGSLLHYEPPQQAIIKYSLALTVMPINPVAYLRRGHAYYQTRQWSQAADDLGLALALDANNKDTLAWLELGTACHESHRLKEAVAAYSRIIQLGDGVAPVYNQRSVARYSLGLWNEAIADLDKALSLQPNFPTVKNNLAWMLATCPDANLRDPVQAVELATQVVAAQPKEGTFCTTLGVTQYRAGDWTAARDTLQKSLELGQGTGSLFWFGRTTLFLAMSHWRSGDKDKARTYHHQAVEWMAKNQPELESDKWRWNELRRFRAEAESVMAQPPGRSKRQE